MMIEKITTGSFLTNSYILSNSEGKCVLIDPGLDYAQTAEYIQQKYQVEAILLTHGHMDHIDGIQYFHVPVYIHEAEVDFLFDSSLSLYKMMGSHSPFQRNMLDLHLIHDGDILSLIGYEFKVLHTPGHTRGSVCYSTSSKVFSGDTLFCGSCGRTDFPTGDALKMRKSLKRIIETYPDFCDVYPGHDEKTTIKKEKNTNPYLG